MMLCCYLTLKLNSFLLQINVVGVKQFYKRIKYFILFYIGDIKMHVYIMNVSLYSFKRLLIITRFSHKIFYIKKNK